jgi:hypothetical protein
LSKYATTVWDLQNFWIPSEIYLDENSIYHLGVINLHFDWWTPIKVVFWIPRN